MKKYLLIFILFFSISSYAQETEPNDEEIQTKNSKISESIEALKTAYITKELDLKPDEAQKFWPVYNEYTGEIKKARLESKDDIVGFEEKKVSILKKYQDNFKKVLGNDDRVKKCFNAAPKFNQLLKKEWIRRQGLRKPNGMMGPRQGGMGGEKPNNNGGERRHPPKGPQAPGRQ